MKLSAEEARRQMNKEILIRVTPEDVGESFTSASSFDAFIKWLEARAFIEAQRLSLSDRVFTICFGARGSGRSYWLKNISCRNLSQQSKVIMQYFGKCSGI